MLAKTVTPPAGSAGTLEFSAARDAKPSGWKISVKADGKDIGGATVKEGWAQVTSSLPDNAGKPLAVEITMEPVKPLGEKPGPLPLSITVPTLVSR